MKAFAIRLLAANLILLGIAACDKDDRYAPPVDNDVIVVTNDADECPRADGQPCK